jgi:hypothetical protein
MVGVRVNETNFIEAYRGAVSEYVVSSLGAVSGIKQTYTVPSPDVLSDEVFNEAGLALAGSAYDVSVRLPLLFTYPQFPLFAKT